MKVFIVLLTGICVLSATSGRAIDLKQSKFTEIVNDVEVISASTQTAMPAALNDIFKVPDVLRTGKDSRAELVADDQTVTRVGANTIFSFDPANRTIDLKQGSLLFHSPHGKGGGTIQTGSATASVLGTTIIVATTPNGGFKVLVLEGNALVKLSGITQHLSAGQMIFVLPGGGISPVIVFRLDVQTKGSKLVGGFKNSLASLNLINKAIGGQLKQIKNGGAVDTGLLVGDSATGGTVQAIPASTIQAIIDSENISSSPTPGTTAALQTDFTIISPTLDVNNIFLNPGFSITIDPNNFLGGIGLPNLFYGFPGHNITINTPTIDMSPYAGQGIATYPKFEFVALNNLNVQGSVDFTGLLPGDQLYLAAGNQLTIASGSTVEADFGRLWIGGFQPISLNNVTLKNTVGELDLLSSGALTLQNNSSLQAGTELNVQSGGDLDIDGSSATALSADLNANGQFTLNNSTLTINNNDALNISGGSGVTISGGATITGGNETIQSSGGSVNVNGSSSITANDGDIDLTSDTTLDVDTSTLNSSGAINLTSDNDDLTVNNATLTASGDINIYGGFFGVGNVLIGGSTLNGDNVYVTSQNGVTINSGSQITANSIINVSAGTDLALDTATLTGGFYDEATLSGDNSITIGNSTVESGSLSIMCSGGTIDINNNSLVKSDTGDINIEANTDATIDTATLNSFGNLTLSADNGGLTLNGATLTGGSLATLSGKNSVNIGNSPITAGSEDIESSAGAITVNNNSSVTASSGDMTMNAHADLTVDDATLNGNNNINLTSANNDLSLNSDTVTANGTVTLAGKTSTTFAGGSLTANTATFQSSGGSITINGAATIAANTITLTAGDGILLDNVTMSGLSPSAPGHLTMTAANTISIGSATHPVDLTGLASVSLAATTINLNDVNFSLTGVYNFQSSSGLAAFNPVSAITGDVNFFNCTVNSLPLTVLEVTVSHALSGLVGINVY